MDLDAMIVQINQEWTRLENRQNELNKELSEVTASMERLRAIKAAAEGKVVKLSATSSRKQKETRQSGTKRPANKGAALGQKNRWYWVAKDNGDKETAARLLADIRKAGKEPWKVEKRG